MPLAAALAPPEIEDNPIVATNAPIVPISLPPCLPIPSQLICPSDVVNPESTTYSVSPKNVPFQNCFRLAETSAVLSSVKSPVTTPSPRSTTNPLSNPMKSATPVKNPANPFRASPATSPR